jgi:hypothetical protein
MGAYTRILRRAEWGATINLRCKNPNSPMSEVGQSRRFERDAATSAMTSTSDISLHRTN